MGIELEQGDRRAAVIRHGDAGTGRVKQPNLDVIDIMFLVGAAGACGEQELCGLNRGQVDRRVLDHVVATEVDGR